MERQYEEELAESIEKAAERYWLEGMDLGYSKRRALVEHTRMDAARAAPATHQEGPIIRLN